MTTDIEIARAATLKPIADIAARLNIPADALEPYGRHKAKIGFDYINSVQDRKDGALVLVTGISPTPAGEGKTTTTVGLGDALNRIGKRATICLREPSLGPSFGMKGGAAGGGYAQVVPMDQINLHFTGDFHAITSANNLLAAMIDNHVYWSNSLGIDPRRISWRRCLDMNDRALRSIVGSLGGVANGFPREDGFDITVASEVMAVFCLAKDMADLQTRLGKMIVAQKRDGTNVTAADIKADGAMSVLLRDALAPNLVQTLEGSPAMVHGGPFANIAHGCNSVMATGLALKLSDVVVTEAGFGADLGAREIHRHQMPLGRPDPVLRGHRRHRARVENAWRHRPQCAGSGKCRGREERHRQPGAPRGESRQIRPAGRGRGQSFHLRHGGGIRRDQGRHGRTRRRSHLLHALGEWQRGRRSSGARCHEPDRERQGGMPSRCMGST